MQRMKKFTGGLVVALGLCTTLPSNNAHARFYVGVNGSFSNYFIFNGLNASYSPTPGAADMYPGVGSELGIANLGLGGRIGFESSSRLYLALEANTSAVGSLVDSANKGFENPLIAAGLAFKIGYATEGSTSKVYGIAFADYLMSLRSATTNGTVFVGGGLGVKTSLCAVLDAFLEAKASVPVFGVINLIGVEYNTSLSGLPSVRFGVDFGLDFHF